MSIDMPRSIPSEYADLVAGTVVPALATINDDGTIQLTPVWAGSDAETLLVNSAKGRRKDRNMRARPHATLMYLDPTNPYRYLQVVADVVEIIDESDPENGHLATETIDDFSERYRGIRPYQHRRAGELRVLYRLLPTKVQASG